MGPKLLHLRETSVELDRKMSENDSYPKVSFLGLHEAFF